MRYFFGLALGTVLSAALVVGAASADQTFGAGRNGASGKLDPRSKQSDSVERYGSDVDRQEDTKPFGAGRQGADGMGDPWYGSRPFDGTTPYGVDRDRAYDPTDPSEKRRPFGAGDAPLADPYPQSRDKSVPNGH